MNRSSHVSGRLPSWEAWVWRGNSHKARDQKGLNRGEVKNSIVWFYKQIWTLGEIFLFFLRVVDSLFPFRSKRLRFRLIGEELRSPIYRDAARPEDLEEKNHLHGKTCFFCFKLLKLWRISRSKLWFRHLKWPWVKPDFSCHFSLFQTHWVFKDRPGFWPIP